MTRPLPGRPAPLIPGTTERDDRAAREVACPVCGAGIGEACRMPEVGTEERYHGARVFVFLDVVNRRPR